MIKIVPSPLTFQADYAKLKLEIQWESMDFLGIMDGIGSCTKFLRIVEGMQVHRVWFAGY
ncbi:hypothetical protein SLEP1_g17099 [Rubroshorea leprosula]|uniref:Uncharacterized protein n=1 Tax=Rubroshorea leprosula TaxID=152421 RepID=A0AAV5IWW4_9ROSI|nr:hypothetical protein SLEP1_g17099 [Rubroshorea leprosula]